jgi:hypothetical protein
MYAPHPSFASPDDENTRIWRFMSLDRLRHVLERRALFFASIVALDDPLEGFLSDATVEQMRRYPDSVQESERERVKGVVEHNLRVMRDARQLVHVSCWHMNEHESAAMWRLYCDPPERGVAIRTTFARLRNAFAPTDIAVQIGVVQYLDYSQEAMPQFNVFDPALRKRKSFEHERELRAAILHPAPDGTNVPVDLDTLIEAIYLCPTAESRLLDEVQLSLQDAHLDKAVRQSGLLRGPLY